ncbi:LOW QUALITY PROTEIN: coiled-coil domain-containing protein 62 [Athene cunicularia]|uniref:LOW QUALITY PROTEIN: coiled-coil domain-containing protein 62 n=1 Tax=Athene cunicularia TaxID=194338 RepID=UPI000EF6A82A|nr:LOW QUALITY PROTEIN: coiled-coil domain-containing protein 62 [Athene cunicularia]
MPFDSHSVEVTRVRIPSGLGSERIPLQSMQRELNKKNEVIKLLIKRLKLVTSQQNGSKTALENAPQKVKEPSQKVPDGTVCGQALEGEDQSHCLVLEQSAKTGQLQGREQELLTMLKQKDKFILETTDRLVKFISQLKKLGSALHAAKTKESSLRKENNDLKLSLEELILETNKLKGDLCEKIKENNKQQEEITHLKQENVCLRNELALTVEEAKRKDQLLQFAKSEQAQNDIELSSLQEIRTRQRRDLQLLRGNLESSQDLRQKHEKAAHERSEENVDLNSFHWESPSLTSLTQKGDRPQRCERFSDEDSTPEISNLSVDQANILLQKDISSPINKLQYVLAELRQMAPDLEHIPLHTTPLCSPTSNNTHRCFCTYNVDNRTCKRSSEDPVTCCKRKRY